MTDIAHLGVKITQQGAQSVRKDVKGLSSDMERAEGIGRKLGISLAVLGTASSVAFFKATQVNADFKQSLANLSAITGAVGDDLEFYSKKARESGISTAFSATAIAEGFKLIASAKPDLLESAKGLNEVTQQVILLSQASGGTLSESARAVGSSLNQFGKGAEFASEYVNILAAASQKGAGEIDYMTTAMKASGSTANLVGLDFAETVAAIQGFAKGGVEAAQAGTGLAQVLIKLEAQTDERLKPSVVGLVGALDELKSRNLDLNGLLTIFTEESARNAATLIAQSDVVTDLNNSIRGTSTAMEQAAINTDTLTHDMALFSSAIEGISLEVFGGGVEDVQRRIVASTTGMINSLTASMDKIIAVIKVVAILIGARIAAAVVTYVASLAAMARASLTTTGSVSALSGALGIQTAAMTTASVATRTYAGASSLLRSGLRILGGKTGLVAAAALAFLAFRDNTEKATLSVNDYSTKLKQLKGDLNAVAIAQVELDMAQTASDINVLREQSTKATPFKDLFTDDHHKARREAQQKLNDAQRFQNALIARKAELLNKTSKVVTETTEKEVEKIIETNEVYSGQVKIIDDVAESEKELQRQRQRTLDTLDNGATSLQNRIDLIGKEGLAREVLIAKQRIGLELLNSSDKAIKQAAQSQLALVETLYEETEALKANEKAEQDRASELKKASDERIAIKQKADQLIIDSDKRLGEAIQKTWRDMLDNGGKTFKSIGESFKSLIKDMIASLLTLATQKFLVNIGVAGGGSPIGGLSSILGGKSGGIGEWVNKFGSGLANKLGGLFKGNGILGKIGGLFGAGGGAISGAVTGPGLAGAAGAIHTTGTAAGSALAGSTLLSGALTMGAGLVLAPALGKIFGKLFGGKEPSERFWINQSRADKEGAATETGESNRLSITSAFGTTFLHSRRVELEGLGKAIKGVDDALASLISSKDLDAAKKSLEEADEFYSGRQEGNNAQTQLEGLKSRYTIILDAIDEGLSDILNQEGTQQNIGDLTVALASIGSHFKQGFGLFSKNISDGVNEFLQFDDITTIKKDKVIEAIAKASGMHNIAAVIGEQTNNFGSIKKPKESKNPLDNVTSVYDQIIEKIRTYSSENESLLDTYNRITAEVTTFGASIERTGNHLSVTTFEMIDIATATIKAAGGLQSFTDGSKIFYDKFTTNGVKFTDTIAGINNQFAAAGVSLPQTRDGFSQLLKSLDLTTASGQKTYGAMIELAASADAYYTILERMRQSTDSLRGMSDSIRDSLLSEEQLYNKRKKQADGLAALISTMTNPLEITNALEKIRSLTGEMYGSLTDSQRKALGLGFADFLDEVASQADSQINKLMGEAQRESLILNFGADKTTEAGNMQLEAANRQVQASNRIEQGGKAIERAAAIISSSERRKEPASQNSMARIPAAGNYDPYAARAREING